MWLFVVCLRLSAASRGNLYDSTAFLFGNVLLVNEPAVLATYVLVSVDLAVSSRAVKRLVYLDVKLLTDSVTGLL